MARELSATRQRALDDAAVLVVDVVVTTLRGGGTVREGLEAASVSGPLAPELRELLQRAESVPLRDVLARWGTAHRSSAVRLAATAMIIALDTGGAQASILDTIGRRVRERAAITREIRAASASARVSAAVIACTPGAFAIVVALVDPSVVAAALRSPLGVLCIVVGVAFQAAGIWWMRRLVDPRSFLASYGTDGIAEIADLLSLCLGAGLDAPAAVNAIAPHIGGGAGRTVRVTATRISSGRRFADEIVEWTMPHALGADARPLVAALVAAHHDGAPAAATIDQHAADLRHAQRQAVNERVQRLPVVLLFPLVGCVLPAFVLLAVMPVALGSVLAMRGR